MMRAKTKMYQKGSIRTSLLKTMGQKTFPSCPLCSAWALSRYNFLHILLLVNRSLSGSLTSIQNNLSTFGPFICQGTTSATFLYGEGVETQVVSILLSTRTYLVKEDYFSVPLAITRRKISGMKDSLVTSSVWKPRFKNPLETFPIFRLEQLEFSIPICDACHLGNRVATIRGVLSGHAYDPLTYEVVSCR